MVNNAPFSIENVNGWISGIIHGDIKPENILIFTDDSGGYTARVTDFSCSTVFANETDLVSMPKSWP